MSTTLPLFWDLSSASKKDRIDASVKLVGSLEQFQAQFAQKAAPAASGSEDEEDEEDFGSKSDGLDVSNAQDVSYSIRRLVRGLASPRESSRLGFAVALTELLSRIDTVTCTQLLDLIMESTKPQGSINGQEERDLLFARLFGIMSVIQSGLAVRITPLSTSASTSTSPSTLESYEQMITTLLNLGEKKSWLRESAWFAINLLVVALHESEVLWKEDAVVQTLEFLFVQNTVWSTEKVALALKLQDLYPKRDWKKILAPTFKGAELLSTGNLATVSRILKESTTDEDGAKDPSKAPSGAWKPQLNFSWDIILDQMLPGPNSKKPAKGSFQDFYRVVVDESLFSSTSSAQRKYWGFQVFQKALQRVNEDSMAMLFTKNFMRTWINHLSKKDRYLHKVALQTATEVQSFVADKPQLGFALILQLTGVNGSQQFDKLTKTKTVESILSSLDAKGIQAYVDYLFSQVNQTDTNSADMATINTRRAWVIEQLGALVRNHKIPKDDVWIQSVLDWLTIHGLFLIKKKSPKSPFAPLHSILTPVLSDELRQTCRDRLLHCLGELSSLTATVTQGKTTKKTAAVASDGEFWLSKVLFTIEQLESDQKHVTLLVEVDDEERELRSKARKTIAKLREIATGDQEESARGAELLVLGTFLQQYCTGDEDGRTGPDVLETCIDGAERLLLTENKKQKKDKKAKANTEDLVEEPLPVDLLVDTIIGFLEKSTSYMRTVGNQVFSLLSESVKESTIDLIVTQLERRDPSQLLEDDGDEDEDEVMEDVEEEASEKDSDSELDDAGEDNEGEDSGDDSNEEEADLELRNKIEEALRVNGIEPATGETDSEEEELMDDDQMMAIDEQLAQVFRSRTNERKSGKNIDAQREATHFKNRVLDLVDTYVRKQPLNPLVLRLIAPLVDLVASSGQDERQLSDKAKGILRSRFGKSKEAPVDVDDTEHVVQIATALHSQARKAHSSDLLSILSLCNVYLAKMLVHAQAESSLTGLYTQSLEDFTTRKNSSLNSAFFQDFIRRFPTQAWSMRKDLLRVAAKAINAYRQAQVLQLLGLLVGLLPSIVVDRDELISFMQSLRALLLGLAEGSIEKAGNLTTAQTKELFKLALAGVRQTKRISPSSTELVWQPEGWRALVPKIKTSSFKASPALPKMCERIAQMSENSGPEPSKEGSKSLLTKRKAGEVNGGDVIGHAKKNKRKKVKGDT